MLKWLSRFSRIGINRESQGDQQNPFTSQFIQRLERLRFVVRKVLFSGTVGEKAVRQKGGRVEFAGHRNYAAGDEPRYIDWNAFARLERLYIKEFAREENIPLYIMLDVSNSMLFPVPTGQEGRNKPTTKLAYTMQLALALGYVGLIAGQSVRLFAFPSIRDGNNYLSLSPTFSSDKQLFEMMEYLSKINRSGLVDRNADKTYLFSALREFSGQNLRRGLLILISDLFENNLDGLHLCRKELERLAARRFLINIMQISSEREGYPAVSGLYKLRDSETGEENTVWVEPQIIATYQNKLLAWREDWHNFCGKHNIKYFFINTATPIEEVVLGLLRKGGLLK